MHTFASLLSVDNLQSTWTSSSAVKTVCIGGEAGVAMQSWAHLEEMEGCYQRAAELRSYSLQEQTSFVPPLRLGPKATEDPIFAPIFGQVGCCISVHSVLLYSLSSTLAAAAAAGSIPLVPSLRDDDV